ncbi:MAG TPA: NAD-dependent epimerase/dehydratase family protein [Nannocystis exedens]|nr:NAD-dependent epimerase/dehydratase family protein [Nannocystis exedens]
MRLSIRESYAGKHVLLTGASGFLGKVWLTQMLQNDSGASKYYILLRRKATRPALARFERIVNTSPAFRPLHEKYGRDLARMIRERIEVIDGDISQEGLGLDEETAARLHRTIDLVVNCAGLVDFDPDLRDALTTNVDGTIRVADFVEACDRAALLHISTCYVAGTRDGRNDEVLIPNYTPNGEPFDAAAELAAARERIAEIAAEFETVEKDSEIDREAREQLKARGRSPDNPKLVATLARRIKREALKNAMINEGQERAQRWGWTNIYTYSKSLAESMLVPRLGKFKFSLLRPAIVESALTYPFPGWNQGFNTCGPLSYMLGGWLHELPMRKGNPFDIIPVDYVGNAMTIAGAALLSGCHETVYQCGTSDKNVLTIDRACDLTALAHRKHLRRKGDTVVDRLILARWDGVETEVDHTFSVPNLRKVTQGFAKMMRELPRRWPNAIHRGAKRAAKRADEIDDKLDTIERLIDLYLPFIHDHHFVFSTDNLLKYDVVEEPFRFDPTALDWRNYWINVHIPGLRKWCYPLFEGRTPDQYRPRHKFVLEDGNAPPACPASHDPQGELR